MAAVAVAPPPPSVRRVAIVRMPPIAAYGLTALLRRRPDITVVHVAQQVDDIRLDRTRIDVVLLDADTLARQQLESAVDRCGTAGVGVVALSRHPDSAVLSGARERQVLCLDWSASTGRLVAALQQNGPSGPATPPPGVPVLTAGELAVLVRYSEGWTAVAVAHDVGLTVHSVNTYLQRIRRKYAMVGRPASSRIGLYHRAVEDGIVPAAEDGWTPEPSTRRREISSPGRGAP